MSRPIACWVALTVLAAAAHAQPSGPTGNLPLPPETLRQRLEEAPFEILEVEEAGEGVMGARKLEIVFPADRLATAAKWKATPADGESWNNAPRREIAAYEFQKLFLDPDDYVVPPVALRCLPIDEYREAIDEDASATIDGTHCVLGMLSAWLHNVRRPDVALQPDLFSRDPRYSYHFANLNLLTFLVDHRDANPGNFLMSTDPDNPQVFSIDNGIAFGGVLYNFFTWHYDRILVGGFPRKSIDRLRALTVADLQEQLGVVAELHADEEGILRTTAPSPNANPSEGVRHLPDGMQFGLTTDEIAKVEDRLEQLREHIDRGEEVLF